jgi:putative membrane protein
MLATVTAWIVVALHLLFALAETVGWTKMARNFGYTKEQTETTRMLALNQGFYNAGLAAVLGWALVTGHAATASAMLLYVVAMAIVGALSARWTIFVVQGVPALIALAAAFFA